MFKNNSELEIIQVTLGEHGGTVKDPTYLYQFVLPVFIKSVIKIAPGESVVIFSVLNNYLVVPSWVDALNFYN